MTTFLAYPRFKAWDTNGDPLAGGKLYSYVPGSTTLYPTYSEPTLTTANSNPVLLNPEGEAVVYLSAATKLVLKTIDGVTLWTMDNVTTLGSSSGEVNVKDYGATGDGTTNDTTAVQTALTAAAGKTCYLPPGTYKITTALAMPNNTVLRGSGPGSIIYQASAGTVGITNANDTVLRDFTLQGPGGAYNLSSIGINGAYHHAAPWTYPVSDSDWFGLRSTIQNLTIKNWGCNGIGAAGGSKILFCRITDCLNEGIIAHGYDILIEGNYISGTYSWGIDVSGSRVQVVDNNLSTVGNMAFLGSEDCGGIVANGSLWTTGSNDIIIRDNIVNGSTNTGISVYAPTGTDYDMKSAIVESNTVINVNQTATGTPGAISVQDSTTSGGNLINSVIANNIVDTTTVGYGIRAWGLTGCLIDGNQIYEAASSAISVGTGGLHNPSMFSIVGNVTSGSPGNVIVLTNTTKFTVANNVISSNVVNGIGVVCTGTTGYGSIVGNTIDTCLVGIYYDGSGDNIGITGNNLANGNLTALFRSGTKTNVIQANNIGVAVPEYANNAAAVAAGLPIGEFYKITGADTLGVVHS